MKPGPIPPVRMCTIYGRQYDIYRRQRTAQANPLTREELEALVGASRKLRTPSVAINRYSIGVGRFIFQFKYTLPEGSSGSNISHIGFYIEAEDDGKRVDHGPFIKYIHKSGGGGGIRPGKVHDIASIEFTNSSMPISIRVAFFDQFNQALVKVSEEIRLTS